MISLNTIVMRNFLSIGEIAQTVTLSNAPLTLLLGLNLDIGGENNKNGSGKTTLLQAICYVLFGEPLTKIKLDNLVNSINQQAMQVNIDFTRDGIPYRIERGRKPNTLRFLVGEAQVDVAQGENKQTQIEIERIIGMSHTMFVHIVALNTFTIPFLKMRPADQREVIEELMGITQISQLAEQLKLVMDGSKEALRDEEAQIKATIDVNARIMQAIEHAQQQADQWTMKQDVLLNEIGERATKLVEIDIEAELKVFDQIVQWSDHKRICDAGLLMQQQAIQGHKATITRLQHDMARYESEATGLRGSSEITRLQAQAAQLRDDAAGLEDQRLRVLSELIDPDAHRCTTCGQGLTGTDHLVTVLKALRSQSEKLADQMKYSIDQATLIDTEINHVLDEDEQRHVATESRIDSVRIAIAAQQAELVTEQRKVASIERELSDLGEVPISRWTSRDALYSVRQEREKLFAQWDVELNKSNPYSDKIDGLTSTLLLTNYDHLNELTLQLKHEQFLYKLLTSKDSFIRKRIIDQNLSYLNRCLNKYLERLGLPHEVIFLPDLTVEITLCGRCYDFEQLSRGEMNRVILATSWSFRDLWENLNHPVNLIFMDECLDSGTDQAGIEAAIEVLTEIACNKQKNIFLISHREELKSQIDTVLLATKEDQFTMFTTSSD